MTQEERNQLEHEIKILELEIELIKAQRAAGPARSGDSGCVGSVAWVIIVVMLFLFIRGGNE